jgi:hypothetical protein
MQFEEKNTQPAMVLGALPPLGNPCIPAREVLLSCLSLLAHLSLTCTLIVRLSACPPLVAIAQVRV